VLDFTNVVGLWYNRITTKGKQMPQFVIEGNKVQTIRIIVEAKDREEALEISDRELLEGDYEHEVVGDLEFKKHWIS
jgi:hypothetical protein